MYHHSGRVDGRRRAAKRAKALAAGFLAQLGGTGDAATLAAVQRAAELVVVAEELTAKALRGEPVDLGELVKVQGVADRAVRALGIKPAIQRSPERSLDQHLEDHLADRGAGAK